MQKKYKVSQGLLTGFKQKPSMMVQDDYNNKIKKLKNKCNSEEDNS